MNKDKKGIKCATEGIVHFWDLPGRNYVILLPEFKNKLLAKFLEKVQSTYKIKEVTGIGRTTICRYIKEEQHKIRLDLLLRIISVINEGNFDINHTEQNVLWIGGLNSQGIINPRLPFNFNFREGARFLAAICNDGWISDGAYYSFNEQDLANSVKNDALSVFGGNGYTVTEGCKDNDKCLAFPSVIRDCLTLITDFRGIKSENNPSVPTFIFKDKNLIYGWIEQTIADEGCVKFYPLTYRREIMWKRAFKKELNDYKLHRNEKEMLNKIGVEYDTYDNVGGYKTINGVDKVTILIRIAKKENLVKLRRLIKIPCERKDKNFSEALKDYERPKEPIHVKDAITKICKKTLFVNGVELKSELKYQGLNAATKWLNFYCKQGLIKRLEDYGGKIPVDYVLNKS